MNRWFNDPRVKRAEIDAFEAEKAGDKAPGYWLDAASGYAAVAREVTDDFPNTRWRLAAAALACLGKLGVLPPTAKAMVEIVARDARDATAERDEGAAPPADLPPPAPKYAASSRYFDGSIPAARGLWVHRAPVRVTVGEEDPARHHREVTVEQDVRLFVRVYVHTKIERSHACSVCQAPPPLPDAVAGQYLLMNAEADSLVFPVVDGTKPERDQYPATGWKRIGDERLCPACHDKWLAFVEGQRKAEAGGP